MSHLVHIEAEIRNPVSVIAVCQRLGLPGPVHGTAQLYSGQSTGLLVQLPGWQYPVVIDTVTGSMHYDNFSGHWGAQEHLDRFLQLYEVETAKLAARKKGHLVTEEILADGWIKVEIVEGN